MITSTIKDYTITSLQNILGILVIKKGTQTREFQVLHGTLYTYELDNLDIHTSEGLHIKSLKTNWLSRFFRPQKLIEPVNTQVTYTSQVHPEDIHKDIRNLTKQTLWEIIMILSE